MSDAAGTHDGPPPARRVLELATGVAGAACGRLFAALGHDVVKCETPEGDPLRRRPPRNAAGVGFGFVALNADKRSVVLDPDRPADRDALAASLEGADVLLTDLPPRRAAAWGLDADTLRQRWPALVVVSLTPYGLGNALSDEPGDSLLAEAYGGLAHMVGEPGQPPLSLGGEQAAHAAAVTGFLGAMLALRGRDGSGLGELVDVAMADVAAYIDWKSDVTVDATGVVPARAGATAGRWRTLRATDGWVGVIVQPEQWDAFAALVGDPRLAGEALRDPLTRQARADRWWPAVEEWVRTRPKRAAFAEAQAHGLAFGYAADVADLDRSEHLAARGFLAPAAEGEPEAGDRPVTGPLVRCDALPWRRGRAPRLGRDPAPAWEVAPDPARPGSSRSEGGPAAPLAGIRVLDFGTITAGAAVGRLLADYGATVVKVESFDHPDSFRAWITDGVAMWSPSYPGEPSPMFESNNAGKLGIAVDLKGEEGRALVHRLASGADVVVENFRVGVTRRLGVDFATLRALNPRLVYLSLSSQGQVGPDAGYRSYGSTLDLLSGLASVTGYPGGRPLWSSADVNYPDQLVSLFGAAIVAYCLAQGVRGVHLDVAQSELVTWTLSEHLAAYRAGGPVPGPTGNRRPGRTPHDVYPCAGADQWVAVACCSDGQRRALAALAGIRPGAGGEGWWWEHQDDVDAAIAAWTAARSKTRCVAALRAAGVPCAPVLSAAERAREAHFEERRVFLPAGPAGRRRKGYPFRLDRYEPPPPGPAPTLGAHSEVAAHSAWEELAALTAPAGRPATVAGLEIDASLEGI